MAIYTYIYIHSNTYTHVYTNGYIHIYTHIYLHSNTYTHVYTNGYKHTHIPTFQYIHTCIHKRQMASELAFQNRETERLLEKNMKLAEENQITKRQLVYIDACLYIHIYVYIHIFAFQMCAKTLKLDIDINQDACGPKSRRLSAKAFHTQPHAS